MDVELTDVPGARVQVVMSHGGVFSRVLVGTMRAFEQDGDERWELVDVEEDRSGFGAYEDNQKVQHLDAVGVAPELVLSLVVLT